MDVTNIFVFLALLFVYALVICDISSVVNSYFTPFLIFLFSQKERAPGALSLDNLLSATQFVGFLKQPNNESDGHNNTADNQRNE